MVSINEIQEAIRVLPETEYIELRKWISELDWERWDSQIEADSEAGRLGFLIAEAREDRERGALEELEVHRTTSIRTACLSSRPTS